MLCIAHLSDIHFKVGHNWISNQGPRIARTMLPIVDGASDLLIVVSGDVAFSGVKKEYDTALTFLNDIRGELTKALPDLRIHARAVPGNHDCNFDQNNEVRETLISSLLREDRAQTAAPSIIDICASLQSDFWAFDGQLSGLSRPSLNRTGYLDVLEIGSHRIELLGLNSAWLSNKREAPGTLAVPTASVPVPESNADFRIAMIHHPANWQTPGSARQFRDFLLDEVDLLLVGHEHDADITELGRPNSAQVIVQDAPALQHDGGSSGFSLLSLDLEHRTLERRLFAWRGSASAYEASEVERSQLTRVGRAAHSRARPKASFTGALGDPGATFTHPRSDSVRLEDLFVWPDINIRPFRKLLNHSAISLRGSASRSYLGKTRKLIVEGTERCGRTSLAKMLARDLLADGKTVLLLDGSQIKSSGPEELLKQCEKTYKAQYDGAGLEALRQSSPTEIAILIDDFDACKLSDGSLVKTLQTASRLFGSVAVFVSDLFGIQELFRHDALKELLDFQHVVMSEFGREGSRDLIERWYSLGSDLLPPEKDYEGAVAEAERYVSSFIGRGLFPSYPICVLTLLQAHEAGTNTDLSAGAYGAIYEALLQSALNRHARDLPVDFLQTFLAEVAMQMLRTGSREQSIGDFEELAKTFMHSTLNEFPLHEVRRALVDARMLVVREGTVRFRYPHIYYLSCSKALQLHKQDPSRRATASAELDRLYLTLHADASSNILMFYLHFTRDLEAVAKLVEAAEELFRDRPIADPISIDFGSKVPWPTDLLGDLDSDQGESIRRYREAQDEADRARVDFKLDDERAIAHLNRYHKAVKAMHLIGQVVRSFPGMLPRDLKLRAARAVSTLSLRTLSDFAITLQSTRTELRAAIVDYLATTRGLPNAEKAMEQADKAIFYMALAAGHGLVRRAIVALGSSHIVPTLDVLRDEGLGYGHELIDMAVRLDLARDRASVKDALAVGDRGSSSGFAVLLVQRLVMDFLGSFRLPTGVRAKFVSAFALQGTQRMLPAPGEMIPKKA